MSLLRAVEAMALGLVKTRRLSPDPPAMSLDTPTPSAAAIDSAPAPAPPATTLAVVPAAAAANGAELPVASSAGADPSAADHGYPSMKGYKRKTSTSPVRGGGGEHRLKLLKELREIARENLLIAERVDILISSVLTLDYSPAAIESPAKKD